MKHQGVGTVVLLALLLLTSCSASPKLPDEKKDGPMLSEQQLEGLIKAPEFPTHLEWLNTGRPLSIKELKGKIILLDFWTFCCINCMHIIPDLKKLEAKYPNELVVIGVHSAKFTNEKSSDSIRQAILRYELKHPVLNDNQFEVWNLYGAHAWPTLVLINPHGRIIGTHSGEDIYGMFDQAIQETIDYFGPKGELNTAPLSLQLEETKQPDTLLSFPGKISADEKGGRLFITDSNHNRIVVTDVDGNIQEVIGSGEVGAEDGAFDSASFDHPQGTYLEGDILYIADTENHLIRAANLKTKKVSTLLGTGQQARAFNLAGKGTEVALNSPWDVVVYDGKLYIAMAGSHQLWVADLKTLEAKPFAGSGREARIDAALLYAALAQPSGITTDGKKLYFADSEISSIRSADIDPKGRVETLVGEDLFEYGDIDGGREVARLQHPLGVTYKDGLVYVTDTYNSKIKIVDPQKKTSTTFAGTGKHGENDGARSKAQFNEPAGLAFLDDKLYIADTNNHHIRILDMKTGKVSSLEFKNKELLNPKKKSVFRGRIVEWPKQNIHSGKGKIILDIRLPKNYKLTQDAPLSIEWTTQNDKVIKFTSSPEDFASKNLSFPLEIPVEAQPGQTEISLDAAVYYCQENSSICLFDYLRIKVPIHVMDNASGEIVISTEVKKQPETQNSL